MDTVGCRMRPAGGTGAWRGSCLPPRRCSLGMFVPGLGFFPDEHQPVPLARARPLLGNSRQRWGEPHQAHARRALPGRPAQAASSATTRRPDSAAGVAGDRGWRGAHPPFPLLPQEGCWGPRLPHQPGWSLRTPSRAGRWSGGARGARPPRSRLLHESVPAEVVITPLEVRLLLRPAMLGAGRQLLPLPLIASETLTHPHPCVAGGRGRDPGVGRAVGERRSVGLGAVSIPPLLAMLGGWMRSWCLAALQRPPAPMSYGVNP